MKNLIITSFLLLFVMSATANNKVGDKLFKMTESLKNEPKLELEKKQPNSEKSQILSHLYVIGTITLHVQIAGVKL